jgi:hypothetical protein
MKTIFFLLALWLGMAGFAQTIHVIRSSFYPHNVGKMKWYLGCTGSYSADTTHWRNPRTIDESVLMFFTDSIPLPLEQGKLKEKLLGFFYNPAIISYSKGVFVLNTKRSVYKKNKIDLRYRRFVEEYYSEMNRDICKLREEGNLDESELIEQFQFAQKQYCREIVE